MHCNEAWTLFQQIPFPFYLEKNQEKHGNIFRAQTILTRQEMIFKTSFKLILKFEIFKAALTFLDKNLIIVNLAKDNGKLNLLVHAKLILLKFVS